MSTAYEPRTIAFGAEIIHPPLQQLDVRQVQTIHNELYQRPELAYQNFQVAQDGVHLTNPGMAPGQVSAALVTPDRIALREEFRNITIEDFATRVVNVASTIYQRLGVQQSIAQVFWARSLISPNHVTDSRELVAHRMLAHGSDALAGFGRPIAQTALSLSFAPDAQGKPAVDVRIAPWLQEPRSLWIEVIGKYTRPVPTEEVTGLGASLYSTYSFLTGPVLNFVNRYDRAE